MRRVKYKGLKQANKCMLMAAIAYNLKKLLKHKAPGSIAQVVKMKKKTVKILHNFILMIESNRESYSINFSY